MRTSTMAHVAIATNTDHGTFTEHWTTSYINARTIVARHVADNGLFRNGYGDAGPLFCVDAPAAPVGHYCITVL